MDTVVLVKQVPDTATRIKVGPDGRDIDRTGVTMVLNPYDEFAVEEALRLREAHGGTVTLLTMGDARAEEVLRTGLAMGADEAVRLDGASADPLQTAHALASQLKTMRFDLILCGKQAVDDDNAQTGALIAEILDLPQATVVVALKVDPAEKSGEATREIEGGHARVKFSLPAVVTAQKGLNDPRYPSLPGIMKAKRKEIAVHPADLSGPVGTSTISLEPPPPRAQGTVITEPDPAKAAHELARLLHEQAKVI